MVCCRDRAARGFETLFWRNHGNEIFRRLFCDLVGSKPGGGNCALLLLLLLLIFGDIYVYAWLLFPIRVFRFCFSIYFFQLFLILANQIKKNNNQKQSEKNRIHKYNNIKSRKQARPTVERRLYKRSGDCCWLNVVRIKIIMWFLLF